MRTARKLLSLTAALTLAAAVVATVARASTETTWTCRSVDLTSGNRFWHDSASARRREVLAADEYPSGTRATVASGEAEVTWTVVAVTGQGGETTIAWMSGATFVPAIDADSYSVGDIAAVGTP